MVQARHRQAQRLLALLLFRLEIEACRAVVDSAEAGDRRGIEKEALGQRRLAGPGMGGQNDAAKVGEVDALCCHGQLDPLVARSSSVRSRRQPRTHAAPALGASPAMIAPLQAAGAASLAVYSRRCQDIRSGHRSSARRARMMSSAALSSPRWGAKSPLPLGQAVGTRTATSAFGWPSSGRAPSTCRWTRSSGPSRRPRAAAKASNSKRSCTRAMARAALPSSSRPQRTTRIGRPRTYGPS